MREKIEAAAKRRRAGEDQLLEANRELGRLFAAVIADDEASLKEMAAIAGVSRTTAYSLARSVD